MDYAPTGNLSAFGPAEISAAADYPGDAELFAQALRETGWIDADGILHDWMDYAGRLVERRAENKVRMREARATHVQRTTDARAGATVPNPTQPNSKKKRVRGVLAHTDPGHLIPAKPDPENLAATRSLLVGFVIPSLEDVAAYCRERKNNIDPERFVSHYVSNGWKVGKNPMKNWRAAVVTWEKGEKEKAQPRYPQNETLLQPDFIGVN